MSNKATKQEKPKEILLMFIGFIIFFAVYLFVPEEVKILRFGGFLLAVFVFITSFLMMLKRRR